MGQKLFLNFLRFLHYLRYLHDSDQMIGHSCNVKLTSLRIKNLDHLILVIHHTNGA